MTFVRLPVALLLLTATARAVAERAIDTTESAMAIRFPPLPPPAGVFPTPSGWILPVVELMGASAFKLGNCFF